MKFLNYLIITIINLKLLDNNNYKTEKFNSNKKNKNKENNKNKLKYIKNIFNSPEKQNENRENFSMINENNINRTKRFPRRSVTLKTSIIKEIKETNNLFERKKVKRRYSLINKANKSPKKDKSKNKSILNGRNNFSKGKIDENLSNENEEKDSISSINNTKQEKDLVEEEEKKEEEEEKEEEDVYELIKITKKKKKNINNLNSFMNSLKNIEEEFDNNRLLNISYNDNLSEDDMKNLLICSAKLRKFGDLNESIKTEEVNQLETDIKQKYYEILTKFLNQQQYKELIRYNNNDKFKGKKRKILYEEIKENENEIEWVLKIKEEPEIEDENNKNINIEGNKDNNKNKKEKKLIYDNSYLFNKKENNKNIVIKKEVLDLLQTVIKYLRKIKINKKPIDKIKLSLFSDIKEDIKEDVKEKFETEEDRKERLFYEKMALFFHAIEKLKKSNEDFDNYDFLKHKEIVKDDKINRLINFSENINSFRTKDKPYKSKFNFLTPIKFKTENFNNNNNENL